jgi:hypothetical protein
VAQTGKASFIISWIDENPANQDSHREKYGTSTSIKTYFGQVNLNFFLKNFVNECCVLVMEMKMDVRDKTSNLNKLLVSVMATNDGVEKKMKFQEGKWTVSWDTPLPAKCRKCDEWPMYRKLDGVLFDICIDFNPLRHLQTSTKTRSTQHLLNLLKNPEGADVTFNFGNQTPHQTLKGHSLVLAAGSPVLAAMFQHNFKEMNAGKVVEIADINSEVFAVVLQFLYTGEVDLKNADAAEVMVAADKYAIDPLKEECASCMSENLTLENVTSHLVLAHLHNVPTLQEATSVLIARNAKSICSTEDWMGVIKDYPELAFAVVQRIANF